MPSSTTFDKTNVPASRIATKLREKLRTKKQLAKDKTAHEKLSAIAGETFSIGRKIHPRIPNYTKKVKCHPAEVD